MKKRMVSAAIIAVALFPGLALAAEEAAEDHGSWLIFLYFAINFTLFASILYYFAGPPVRKFFVDRATTIRGSLSRADAAYKAAQDLANQAAAKLASLEAELKHLAEEIDNETKFQVARIGEVAKATQDRIHRDTELSTAALSDAAQRRVRERLSESAATLARDVITRNFERADQGRLIDGFMDRLSEGATR